MPNFKELIPTVSGPGSFLVSLIFISLFLTSGKSRSLILNWQFAVALVAISLPLSILITQIYHAYFIKYGYTKKIWGPKYKKYKINMSKLDAMFDYLSWAKSKGDKEWVIIQKKASAYNLFNMLFIVSLGFFYIYAIILIVNIFERYFDINVIGVILTSLILIASNIIFLTGCEETWDIYQLLDRRLLKDIEEDLEGWIKEEII